MRLKFLLPLIVLAIASCSTDTETNPTESPRDEPGVTDVSGESDSSSQGSDAQSQAGGDVNPEELFDFAAPELETDAIIDGSDLFDQRPLIITFVVPQCPVCQEEAPEIAESAIENSEISYVFIHSGADADAYNSYIQSAELVGENTLHIRDDDAALWERFGVSQQPSTVLVTTSGAVTSSTGALGIDGLTAAVDQVLNG